MRYLSITAIILLCIFSACKSDEREKLLSERAALLDMKEQELELRQQSLARKEDELIRKERSIDSISNQAAADTLAGLHPGLPGKYNVEMRCTETSCPESAVGDTKSEQWVLTFFSNQLIAKAMSDQKLLRVYRGAYTGNTIQLIAQADSTMTLPAGNMIVRLQEAGEGQLRGVREITRPNNCRIVYDLNLQKQ